jgi:uncharacterized membrane protein
MENPAVWTYRGYEMRPGEFNTAMVHYYRAEVQRANIWRTRLDTTTNWAVISVGAALTFTFSDVANSPAIILMSTFLIALFLVIEARRYRYYELWSYRIRLLETEFFAAMLAPPYAPNPHFGDKFAETLRNPRFTISFLEAFGRRFRRNYQYIFLILALAWILKASIHPDTVASVGQLVRRLGLGILPGELMLAAGIIFNGVLFAIGYGTIRLRQAKGEILDYHTAMYEDE